MNVRDFDFDLPPDLIAQHPSPVRGASRLLVLDWASGAVHHSQFSRLPEWLRSSDVVVVNDTRVFPARLIGRRTPSGGHIECLLLSRVGDDRWEALVHPGQKLHPGSRIEFGSTLRAEVLEQRFFGRRVIRLWNDSPEPVEAVIDAIGHVPLPPYIKRSDEAEDVGRYQTVYARSRGSVAAPTAGLHFTEDMLSALDRAGIDRVSLTLHVGYGTFKPVRVERVEDHEVDPESYDVSASAASRINRALEGGRRIVAVGTTTTRALETAARDRAIGIAAGSGVTDLFIYPGFEFRVVGALLTNFHLPRSSLLMLVAAFGGRERVLSAYREAVRERYRFYSYGDAMLVL